MEREKLKAKSEKLKTANSWAVLCLLFFIFHFSLFTLCAQTVGINATGAAGNSSAMLDVSSTTGGFLLPRMTSTQMKAISNPDTSLMVYNTTNNCLMMYSVRLATWQTISCPCSTSASFTENTDATFNANTRTNVLDSNNAVTLASSQTYTVTGGTTLPVTTYSTTPSTSYTLAITAGTYTCTSFTISAGVTVTVTGTQPLVIYCTGTVTINGTLKMHDSDGTSARLMTGGLGCGIGIYETSLNSGKNSNPNGGAGGPGGYKGGSGSESTLPASKGSGSGGGGGSTQYNYSGGGGGYGTAGGAGTDGNTGGLVNGTSQLTTFAGGSGGGAGAGNGSTDDGGAGGGGGGAVKIIAPNITIGSAGAITANGGVGGGGEGAGGGGSGGAIWLISASLTNNGVVEALGGAGGCSSPNGAFGGNGGYGRIRLDYLSSSGINYNPVPGYTTNLLYTSTGTTVTATITPTGLCSWGALIYNVNMPAGTKFTVDVLSCSTCTANPLATNVSSGTNLSDFSNIANQTSIALRGNFSTTNTSVTPTLYNWTVNYTK